MAETTSIVSGVARRYAGALFEVALESGVIDAVGQDLDTFDAALAESADLRRLVGSPVFSADEQTRAVGAVLAKLGIGGIAANFVSLAARNRRLFVLPGMIEAYRQLVAAHRGERVAHRRERWVGGRQQRVVVGAHHRDVVRDATPGRAIGRDATR